MSLLDFANPPAGFSNRGGNVVHFLRLQGLLNGQKMFNEELLRDDLLSLGACGQTVAIPKARRTRGWVEKARKQFPNYGRMIRHLAERIHFPILAALDHFAGEFRRPLKNMAWSSEG